eukprot:3965186-Alexandrium_andersonii.AAC.1
MARPVRKMGGGWGAAGSLRMGERSGPERRAMPAPLVVRHTDSSWPFQCPCREAATEEVRPSSSER